MGTDERRVIGVCLVEAGVGAGGAITVSMITFATAADAILSRTGMTASEAGEPSSVAKIVNIGCFPNGPSEPSV
jgi:hypothetical protein